VPRNREVESDRDITVRPNLEPDKKAPKQFGPTEEVWEPGAGVEGDRGALSRPEWDRGSLQTQQAVCATQALARQSNVVRLTSELGEPRG